MSLPDTGVRTSPYSLSLLNMSNALNSLYTVKGKFKTSQTSLLT
ncbi:MAG: hypothetical protein QXJ93_01170 [Candidatus Rehaiarchaeum fermentans]